MKTRSQKNGSLIAFIILLFSLAQPATAQLLPPGYKNPQLLDSWSFKDTNTWTDDFGDAPISFTNITWSPLGDFFSLVVNSNAPAWLNYEIYQTDVDATNLIVNGPGSITFWYAPADWSSGTNGGTGPGQWAQLISVGEWTPDSSYGYWGISIDPSGSNLLFSAQDGFGDTYALSTPVSWTTNYFRFIALTYSSTNVSIYLDGQLATNDPGGLSIWPGPNVIANGVFFGSNTNGNEQAQGLLDTVQTYDVPLDSNDVQETYNDQNFMVEINPLNEAMQLGSAPSEPSYTPTYEAISGPGNLVWVANASSCVDGSSAYDVWITNVTASVITSGTNVSMNMTFTIEGGQSGVPYDVFANSVLHGGTNGIPWTWMGQGYQCTTYMLTNLPMTDCFLMLGTPYTSNPGLGLTDAYELLVLQVSPNGPQYDAYGVPYAWYAQHGLTPITGNLGTQDPDMDDLLNYQEYLYGTNPQVSEGFAIWVGTPNGTSSIP